MEKFYPVSGRALSSAIARASPSRSFRLCHKSIFPGRKLIFLPPGSRQPCRTGSTLPPRSALSFCPNGDGRIGYYSLSLRICTVAHFYWGFSCLIFFFHTYSEITRVPPPETQWIDYNSINFSFGTTVNHTSLPTQSDRSGFRDICVIFHAAI